MSQLWDIHQTVRTLAEEIVSIHYPETTSEDIEDFIYAAFRVIFKSVQTREAVIVTCSYDLRVSKANQQSKTRL
jgi:hypothetical protein